MGGENSLWAVLITLIGATASVVVARISRPRVRPDPEDPPTPALVGAPDGLLVSPEIWRDLSGRISGLESEVRGLKDLVIQQGERVNFLERLLRRAMRIIRAQSRTLRKARLQDEPIPAVLMPYSID